VPAPPSLHNAHPPRRTGKLDVKLVLRFEDLDVEGTVGGEVLHSPGSQDGLVVLGRGGGALEHLPLRVGRHLQAGAGLCSGLTAAVRSTSFLLLRIKQASPLSILQDISC
jgi:hypothetical protein